MKNKIYSLFVNRIFMQINLSRDTSRIKYIEINTAFIKVCSSTNEIVFFNSNNQLF